MSNDVISVRRVDFDRGPLEIQHDKSFLFQYDVYRNDIELTVDSATVTLYENTPDDPWIDALPAPIVTGRDETTSNRVTFLMDPAVTDYPTAVAENLVGFFVITFGSESFEFQITFDLVRMLLVNTLTEDELFSRTPSLRDMRMIGVEEGLPDTGTGTVTGFTAVVLSKYSENFYTGGEVEIIAGTNESSWREVVAFNGVTGAVVVGAAWPAAIDDTSVYRIRASWLSLINEAWAEIKWRIRSLPAVPGVFLGSQDFARKGGAGVGLLDGQRGRRPALMMDSSELRVPHIYLVTAMAYESAAEDADDPNWRLGREYRAMFEDAFMRQRFTYDTFEDGTPDETQYRPMVINMRRY